MRYKNPLSVLEDIFVLRDQLKLEKVQTRLHQSTLSAAERTTVSSRAKSCKRSDLFPKIKEGGILQNQKSNKRMGLVDFTAKETTRDYVALHAQIGYLDIRLAQQKVEMNRLAEEAREGEVRVSREKKIFEENKIEFLKSLEQSKNDRLQAEKEAQDEELKKQHTDDQLKMMKTEQAKTENDIYELEENLKQCDNLKKFLSVMSPPEWESEAENHKLFVDDPEKVTELLMFLERDVERAYNVAEKDTTEEHMDNQKKYMQKEMDRFIQETEHTTEAVEEEKKRVANLKLQIKFYSSEKNKSREKKQERIDEKVREVLECIGTECSNLSTLNRLAHLESHLIERLEKQEELPEGTFLKAQKAYKKEKGLRQQAEKLMEVEKKREVWRKKILERALAEIKRPTGKKEMTRSYLPVNKKRAELLEPLHNMGEDDIFF
ncbi:golgin subfamily A member 6-like protein 22 isoform X2 [Myxocyprinus asiaticus]|nr:golgin subfamily A member 6-like protein 22 isoform X2 [Myxocyprinus asiaticus]